jgi:chromosome segregation ATPase
VISQLEAQLEGLQTRRANLNRVIGDLSRRLATGVLAADARAQAGFRQALAERRAELAEVSHQQHELGVQLVRARRRQDMGDPTTLWVRRVTH